jgi:hypothetical protein
LIIPLERTNNDPQKENLGILPNQKAEEEMEWTMILKVWGKENWKAQQVGIATGYGLDDRGVGVQVPLVARFFSFSHHPYRLWNQAYYPIFPGVLLS